PPDSSRRSLLLHHPAPPSTHTLSLHDALPICRSAPLATHLGYLRREGVTRDGEKARLFGPAGDDIDPKGFTERCEDDRHHFRFIDRKSTRLNSSHVKISYAVFCLKKKNKLNHI